MNNVVIIFDEIALVLTKNDYTNISQYFKTFEDLTFGFLEKDLCFVVLDNEEPLAAVFFSKVKLEGKECYEISRIKHKLDNVPKLPDELDEFNQATGEVIKKVFNLLNEAIIANEITQNEMYHKYYIRNKKTGVYDIYAIHERVNIAEFIDKLSYVFAISD